MTQTVVITYRAQNSTSGDPYWIQCVAQEKKMRVCVHERKSDSIAGPGEMITYIGGGLAYSD